MPTALGGGHTRPSTRRPSAAPDPAAEQQRKQAIEQARGTDLVQLASRYTTLRRKAAGEFCGPCPKCGGEDRFTVDARGWFCRTCRPYDDSHGWYGAIDFAMWITGLNFTGAVGFLTGVQMTTNATWTQRPPQPAQPERTEPSNEWRTEAGEIVSAAQAALWLGNNAGAEYLYGRGLEPHTWQAFGMGFGEHGGRLAIVLPWYRGGKLNAIRYRFLAPTEDGQRIIARHGSRFSGVLYGGQALLGAGESHRTLVLCEGEINAASIWQVAHETAVDVLSLGSESARLTDAMITYAAQYRHIIVWMDKREVAAKLRDTLPPRTVALSSPEGKDANDLLRIGKLGAFLAAVRVRACNGDQAHREGLLWDLVDAARLPGGIDAGTGQAAVKLAGELGKAVKLEACPDGQWRVM